MRGRSLTIHAGEDNYSDQPEPLAGGGTRIACGVIEYACDLRATGSFVSQLTEVRR